MLRTRTSTVALTAAALLLLPAAAEAKPKRAKAAKPQITRVTPMRVELGERLTIRGRHFNPQRKRNTVIFRSPNGRTAFVKPQRATRRKLTLKVPASVAKLLRVEGLAQQPTRLKLRVLAGRFSAFTPRRLSPVVVGSSRPTADNRPPKVPETCKTSADHDGDLLANDLELRLGTDPCLRDTDGDGVDDGYEMQAAIDLNHYPATPPLPYPGKRPYPNALDPSDGSVDYDGDGLLQREEFQLWVKYAADGAPRSGPPTSLAALLYSDGLQHSVTPPPAAPADPLANWALDMDGNGVLADDERDADADGLANWDEVRGRFTEVWWPAQHNGTHEPKESAYPAVYGNFLDNADLPNHDAHADPDMDGDGVVDGMDDHDHDGLSNQFEVARPVDWMADAGILPPAFPAPNPWAYVNPFNPCKPFDSERCHDHPPFGHYDGDEVPPIGPEPPAGYPDSRPPTPDGP